MMEESTKVIVHRSDKSEKFGIGEKKLNTARFFLAVQLVWRFYCDISTRNARQVLQIVLWCKRGFTKQTLPLLESRTLLSLTEKPKGSFKNNSTGHPSFSPTYFLPNYSKLSHASLEDHYTFKKCDTMIE